MTAGHGRVVRRAVALLALALMLPACSSDGSATATTTTGAEAGPSSATDRWVVSDDGGGVVVDAPTYRLEISPAGVLSVYAPDVADVALAEEVEAFIVRDGQRLTATEVVDTKPGLDHVTLFVMFSDATSGRVEIGAATPDTIAVAVSADDPTGVVESGIGLQPADVAGTYRLPGP